MIDHELLATLAASMRCPPGSVVRSFRSSTREDLARLRTFVAAAERKQIVLYAHRLKGASQMIGAASVAHASSALEATAGGGAPQDRIAGALAELERALSALDAYLETLDA